MSSSSRRSWPRWKRPRSAGSCTNGNLSTRVMPELRAIVELCRRMRTVAEISALLKMPLGVVRVLLSDLADQGKIRVYGTGHGTGQPTARCSKGC